MRDPDYADDQLIVVNFVNHPIVADADTPQVIGADQPCHTWRSGVPDQGCDVAQDPGTDGWVQLG
jgi:hypothetical protein